MPTYMFLERKLAHPEGPALTVRKEETEAHTAGLTNCRAAKRQPISAGTESTAGESAQKKRKQKSFLVNNSMILDLPWAKAQKQRKKKGFLCPSFNYAGSSVGESAEKKQKKSGGSLSTGQVFRVRLWKTNKEIKAKISRVLRYKSVVE